MSDDRYQSHRQLAARAAGSAGLGLPTPPASSATSPASRSSTARCCSAARTAAGSRSRCARCCARSGRTSSTTRRREGGTDADLAALVFDATGIDEAERLRPLYDFFHPTIRSLRPQRARDRARPAPPEQRDSPRRGDRPARDRGLRRARSPRRSAPRARPRNLVRVARGGEGAIESTLRFLLSARSAYVDGQVIRVAGGRGRRPSSPDDWEQPLAGRVAAVTGAARGIGESIADVARARRRRGGLRSTSRPAGEALTEVANRIGGDALQLDITADRRAGSASPTTCAERHGGSTCSSTTPASPATRRSAAWSEEQWDAVLDVNLAEPGADQRRLLERDLLGGGGRDRLRLLGQRDRRQPRPDELRDHARPGSSAWSTRSRPDCASAARRSTPSRRASSRRR